jgi:hypothetical protein
VGDERFGWHPEYQGRTVGEVESEVRERLRSDQRAYALALEGAERHESDALASVLPMERRWGAFDLDWAEADAATLAGQVVAFERERDRRRELFPYSEFRNAATPAPGLAADDERPWWAFWRR